MPKGLIKKGQHLSSKTEFKKGSEHPNFGKRGKGTSNWKGGIIQSGGYIFIFRPGHPFASDNGYIRQHRLVLEEYLGRYLKPYEIVHHKNGNKLDNRFENLEIIIKNTKGFHAGFIECPFCNKQFLIQ